MIYKRLELITKELPHIQDHTILIFGLGGVGSFAVESLARSGFRRMILVDFDVIDPTNINRQLFALQSTIERKKTEVARERILDIDPTIRVTCIDQLVTSENISSFFSEPIDFCIDAIDDVNAKLAIAKFAQSNHIPLISAMGFANKLDPSKIKISTLQKTEYCPLAKKMRLLYRRDHLDLKQVVIYSTEDPITPFEEGTLGSSAFVPSVAGLMIGSYVFRYLKGEAL